MSNRSQQCWEFRAGPRRWRCIVRNSRLSKVGHKRTLSQMTANIDLSALLVVNEIRHKLKFVVSLVVPEHISMYVWSISSPSGMLAEGHATQPAFTLLAADVEKFKFLKEPRLRTWSRAQDYFLFVLPTRAQRSMDWHFSCCT
jgi:hypothetical protein